jgi:hypothetical protein
MRNVLVALAIAGCLPSVMYGKGSITFLNASKHDIYITVRQGACPQPTKDKTFFVSRNHQVNYPTAKDVCYQYGWDRHPEDHPFAEGSGWGTATPTRLVVIDATQPKARSAAATASVNQNPTADPTKPLFETVLGDFNDPLNRQSATDCVKEASGTFPVEWRTCVGWRTQWRCVHHKIVLIVDGYSRDEIATDAQQCLLTAGVVSTAAAVISDGGVDPGNAFITSLTGCLAAKGRDHAKPRLVTTSDWTDWGGC